MQKGCEGETVLLDCKEQAYSCVNPANPDEVRMGPRTPVPEGEFFR